jgi:glycosyltransferase involved in cell wall biosynthesis
MKIREGTKIRKHAYGAFAQGRLAERALRMMGVPERMIEHLYYSPAALETSVQCSDIINFSKGRRVFLYVGALCKRKGVDVLLKAFSRLSTDEWCLVLCGLDRAKGAYAELAGKLDLNNRVLFLGAWPSHRIAEVYSAADVLVLPSRFDGWGAVINEGASMGLPVIGTDLCGAAWHVIEQEGNGFRVHAGSVRHLSCAMKSYVDSPELLVKHGNASSAIYASEFTPKANADRFVRAMKKWNADED